MTIPEQGPERPRGAESDDARRNRQLTELLNELRVALPGVQMLFGFLLAVPFSQRFTHVTSDQQALYYTAFVTAAAASVCFIAPTSFHRIVWRHGDKGLPADLERAHDRGHRLSAVAIISVMLFITSYLYGSSYAAVIGSLLLGMLVVLWYVLRSRFGCAWWNDRPAARRGRRRGGNAAGVAPASGRLC